MRSRQWISKIQLCANTDIRGCVTDLLPSFRACVPSLPERLGNHLFGRCHRFSLLSSYTKWFRYKVFLSGTLFLAIKNCCMPYNMMTSFRWLILRYVEKNSWCTSPPYIFHFTPSSLPVFLSTGREEHFCLLPTNLSE